MSRLGLNLAQRPFVNRRPVVRLAILLWIAGALALAGNALLFGRYVSRVATAERDLAEAERRRAGASDAIAEFERRLAELRLADQNEEVRFLNQRIAERTFSFNRLFDRMATVLPRAVRLYSLSPQQLAVARPVVAEGNPDDQGIYLRVRGAAETDEDLLDLVDALFAHPAFRDPNLARESRQGGRLLDFDLSVTYLPEALDPGEESPKSTASSASAAGGPGPAAGEPASTAGEPGQPPVAETARGSGEASEIGGIAAPVTGGATGEATAGLGGAAAPRLAPSSTGAGAAGSRTGAKPEAESLARKEKEAEKRPPAESRSGWRSRRESRAGDSSAWPAAGGVLLPSEVPLGMTPAPLKPTASGAGGGR